MVCAWQRQARCPTPTSLEITVLIRVLFSVRPWAYPSVGCGGCEMTLEEDPMMAPPDERALAQRRVQQEQKRYQAMPLQQVQGGKSLGPDAQRHQDQGCPIPFPPTSDSLAQGPGPCLLALLGNSQLGAKTISVLLTSKETIRY